MSDTTATAAAATAEQPKAEQPPKIAGIEGYTAKNVQASRDLVNEYMAAYRAYLANISNAADRTFKAIELITALYQKLAVFDGAIIALSITLLGSLISYTPGHHIPKLSFLLLVCPAWLFLLLSMAACFVHIASRHGDINAMHDQLDAATTEHDILRMSTISQNLLNLPLPPWQQIAANVKELQEEHAKAAEHAQAAMKKVGEINADRSTGVAVLRVAHLSMLLGVVLLCIYAVKMLLTI